MYKTRARVLGYRADGRPIHQIRGGAPTPLEVMQTVRSAKKTELDELLAAPTTEARSLTADESARFDAIAAEIRSTDERITELTEQETRSAAVAEVRKEVKATAEVTEPATYQRGDHTRSYWKDLADRELGRANSETVGRLQRHGQEMTEKRALGNTNTTGGSGGEFAPPEWIIADYVALARPARPLADLYKHADIPNGVSSVNLPRITGGTTVALQTTQNTALSQTDLTTAFVGSGLTTIGGKELVAQQLLDQSGVPFDEVITSDLAADYTRALDFNVWNGAGTGVNNNSVVNGLLNAVVPAANVVTYTSGSPTAQLFYSKAAGALAAFATNRFAEPTHWIMHPRRWFWLLAQSDNSGRPLVVPDAMFGAAAVHATNPIARNVGDPVKVTGYVGMFLGLPVIIDPLAPTNFGAGTNQDRVYLVKADDLWLFEGTPVAEVFRQTYADTMGVLFRIYNYVAAILNRQPFSIAYIDGTGLIAPTF